ncbi:MAG TPA: ATP-binding cassette domain-containing protein [Verrucomicrobiae bacterium]|nr:ATP-binding cassette domain-containing protein [Verrucomicrobiae bacterium]
MSSAEAPTPALRVRGLIAGYSEQPVVDGVDIDVGRGQVVAVAGLKGAAKSTPLTAILGIARLLGGTVALEGRDVTGLPLQKLARLGVGYVPQVDEVEDPSVLDGCDLVLALGCRSSIPSRSGSTRACRPGPS